MWNTDFLKNIIPDSSQTTTISFQHLVHVSHPQCCSGYPSSGMWLRMNTQEHYSTVTQLMSTKRSCGSAGGTVLPPFWWEMLKCFWRSGCSHWFWVLKQFLTTLSCCPCSLFSELLLHSLPKHCDVSQISLTQWKNSGECPNSAKRHWAHQVHIKSSLGFWGLFFFWKEGRESSSDQLTKYSTGQMLRNLANLGFSGKTLHLNHLNLRAWTDEVRLCNTRTV